MMKKGLKRSLKIGGIVVGAFLLFLVAALLLVFFNKSLVKNILQARLERETGMTVRIGRLDYRLFPLRVAVGSLEFGREDAFQKMDVSLARFEAAGHLGKLLRGHRPAFQHAEAEGLEVGFVEKALSPEPVDYEAIARQIEDLLAHVERVDLRGGRTAVSMLPYSVDVEGMHIEIASPGPKPGRRTLLLDCRSVRVDGVDGSFSFRGGFRAGGRLIFGPTTAGSLRAAVLSPRLSAGGVEGSFGALLLEADGLWESATRNLRVSRFSARVPGLLDVAGAAAAAFKQGPSLELYATARVEDLEQAARLLKDRLPPEFREARFRGWASAEGLYSLSGPSGDGTQSLQASVELGDVRIDHALSGIPVRAGIEGRLDLEGLPPGIRVSGDLRSSLAGFTVDQARVGPSSIRLQGTAAPDSADVTRLDVRIDGLTLPVEEGKEVRFEKVALSGRAAVDVREEILEVRSLRAVLGPLPPIEASARLALDPRGRRSVRLEGRGFGIPVLREFLGPFIPEHLAEWEADGSFDLTAEARNSGPTGGGWEVSAGMAFSGVAFNDPSFTIAGEGLEPALKIEGTYAPGDGGFPFSASLTLSRGESLFKSFYVSWDKHPVEAALGGRYDPRSESFAGLAGRLLFPTIGEVDIAGSARTDDRPSFDLRCEARLGLEPFYSLTTQAGVAEESRMRLEGDLTADLRIEGHETGGLTVRGRMALADTALENPAAKLLLTGISADIPILYESGVIGDGTLGEDLPEQGFLRIGGLQSPFLSLDGLDLGFRAGVNAYAVHPLGLDLFGGRLETGPTTVLIDPRSGAVRGAGSLALHDLDISLFPIESPQFKLTGVVRAEFPSLDLTSERIAVSGRGEADIFGGQVVLRDLAVDRPFTAGRAISLNIDLLDLDLKKLTDEVPFGEVTGIVRGEVRNLVLSYGQPERFEFRLESVRRKGVAQTFSLKAVDNLTVLSSGEQASAGTSQFWMRFLRGFPYEKLGIVSTLRNDTFTLNGTIREGGVEYLVKKPPLFGINVVNRMPEKVISFREMTNRLRRVGQSER